MLGAKLTGVIDLRRTEALKLVLISDAAGDSGRRHEPDIQIRQVSSRDDL